MTVPHCGILRPRRLSAWTPFVSDAEPTRLPAPQRRRQTQADVAPNPNPCQLFPIAAHCRFEPFQGLGRYRKRDPAFALAAPAHLAENTCGSSLSRPNFLLARSSCRSAPPLARLRFPTSSKYVGRIPIYTRVKRNNFALALPRFRPPAAPSPGSRGRASNQGRRRQLTEEQIHCARVRLPLGRFARLNLPQNRPAKSTALQVFSTDTRSMASRQ